MAIMSTIRYINQMIKYVTFPAVFAISLLPAYPIYFQGLDKRDSDALARIHIDLQQGLYDMYEERRKIQKTLNGILKRAENELKSSPDYYAPKRIGKPNDGYARRITPKGKYR